MKRYWKREEIEDFALVTLLDFRRRTGLRLAPPIDVDLVGELGCGLQWDWDVLPEPPQTLVWAALFPHEARVILNETHAAKFAASRGLERFTKAHEIGHWLLHVDKEKGEYSGDFATPYIVRGALTATRTRAGETNWLERHADWFAAALLMPANVFVPAAEKCDWSTPHALVGLARRFGVSRAAARARLCQLGFALPIHQQNAL
jgi:hypothetical protein